MNRLLRGIIVVAATACALLVGTTGALAAPGNGAVIVPTFCSLSVPGIGGAEGPGTVTMLPNGSQVINCKAELLATATAPARAVKVEFGNCIAIVTPSGHVAGVCRP